MTSERVPHAQHVRHRLYPRLRHNRHSLQPFITDEIAALASSASGQTVAPKRTTNTKAEALITFGGQPANANFVTIGNFTYTFKTALTEVKAAQTLTNDGTDVSNTDTVTIDGVVYTFKTTLTEVKASGTLTNDGTNITNGDTVVIDGKTYTFQDTLTDVDGHVLKGASNTASMTNLFHAINASGGTPGTDYATSTTAHPTVVATNPSGTTVVATAKSAGVAGNSIATSETSSHLSWSGPTTLAGGVNSVAREVKRGTSNTASMTSLYEAINAGANAGTDYSSATVAHSTVSATNPSGTTVVVAALTSGVAGNSIAVTEASSHLSWGGTGTLAGGIDPVANEIFIDDTAAHTRDNLANAINLGSGAGTKYSRNTATHDKVVASASSGNLLVTALDVANVIPGMSVRLAKSGANITLPTLAQLDGPLWTATGHAYVDGEGPLLLTTSVSLPAGFPVAGTEVWAHVVDTNTIALATSLDAARTGNFIRTTSAGSGTHTLKRSVVAKGFFDLMKRNKPRTIAAATDIDSLK